MAMETNLNLSGVDVVPGVEVLTDQYNVRNFGYKTMLEDMALMSLALLECPANNGSSSVSRQEALEFNLGLYDIVKSYNDAKDNKTGGSPIHELVFEIALPKPREIQGMANNNLKKLNWHLYYLFQVVLGGRDAEQNVWIGPSDENSIDAQLVKFINVARDLIGTGLGVGIADPSVPLTVDAFLQHVMNEAQTNSSLALTYGIKQSPQFDTGRRCATYPWLGRVVPGVGAKIVVRQEPSKYTSPGVVPDAVDTKDDGK
jgi:hypothetical protein